MPSVRSCSNPVSSDSKDLGGGSPRSAERGIAEAGRDAGVGVRSAHLETGGRPAPGRFLQVRGVEVAQGLAAELELLRECLLHGFPSSFCRTLYDSDTRRGPRRPLATMVVTPHSLWRTSPPSS